ncbi:DUF4105 domain-containing protein [Flavobacterium sp. NKUCC04_CG]|uniref:lipoprotein N-acyltransferase Lnb domain-containing protein n=1 Tax=Flavobacterium sp. NKUCC04_CG TaxID=2842121 RepID=UPI001C5BF545|nr:DUF4105 domain-containing protein [Flavobacterium sp. NKUCC04_CG]MBW3519554.1 DUF4105 domain-containing protein [Flavobacterium sp. NKUCC04_CG]
MKIIISLFFGLLSIVSWCKDSTNLYPELTNRAEISILTVGTGSQLYTLFGHTALRVYDPLMRVNRVYNYGLFDFSTPNFYAKFIKGDLLYYGGYEDYGDFVMGYAYEDRPVYEQHLTLNENQKQQLWQLLNRSLEDDQKAYRYKFIHQNCTTKVVDLLNKVLLQPIEVEEVQHDESYRYILNQSLQGHFFEKLGINLVFSSQLDQKAALLFLPDKFMQGLAITTVDGKPLVDKTTEVFKRQSEQTENWWNTYTFFAIAIFILALLLKYTWVRYAYFVVIGLLGCLLVLISFYSSHVELAYNNTPLLCNPLLLLLPFLSKRNKWGNVQQGIYGLIGLTVILFIIVNLTSEKLVLTLPLVILTLWALFKQINVEKRKA